MRINLADSKGQIIVSVEIKKGDTLEKGQDGFYQIRREK